MATQSFTPDTYMATMATETWREFGFRATGTEDLAKWQRALLELQVVV